MSSYSQLILARKGPLGKIWLAAHWDKKLTKLSVLSTDISESVESILDPATPLALRVSGHLMLGVVRIYARKVKYLMADVTEVMWKVKMAYKVNAASTVDMTEAMGNVAIDDPRYFGTVQPEYDFPELLDTAFSQNMLTQYAELRAARVRTVSSSMQETALRSATKKRRATAEDDGSVGDSSRVSDVELMRGGTRSTLEGTRSSLLSANKAFIEEEIPVYVDEELYNETSAVGLDEAMYGGANLTTDQMIGHLDSPQLPQDVSVDQAVSTGLDVSPVPAAQQGTLDEFSPMSSGSVLKRRVNTGKRKRLLVTLDERVELSSKTIKEFLADRGPILRRLPGERLPRVAEEVELTAEQMLSLPSVRDLCPELMELFQMTMTMGSLPFPLIDGIGKNEHREQQQEQEEEEEDVEGARLGALDDPRVSIEGRMSAGKSSPTPDAAEGFPIEDLQQQYEEAYPLHSADMELDNAQEHLSLSPPTRAPTVSRASFLEGFGNDAPGEGAAVGVGGSSIEACSARTAKVIEELQGKFKDRETMTFEQLSGGVSRRNAAACFFEVLQLNTWGLISVDQPQPFGDITMRPKQKLWATVA